MNINQVTSQLDELFESGKTNEVDSEGNPIRKWDLCWDYDNDKKEMSL